MDRCWNSASFEDAPVRRPWRFRRAKGKTPVGAACAASLGVITSAATG
jgi:hypothetical protein